MYSTQIQKWGNSQGIRLPKFILEEACLSGNEDIDILVENQQIVIRKARAKERKNIKELFAGYEGEYEPVEMDWGKPVGKEIW